MLASHANPTPIKGSTERKPINIVIGTKGKIKIFTKGAKRLKVPKLKRMMGKVATIAEMVVRNKIFMPKICGQLSASLSKTGKK